MISIDRLVFADDIDKFSESVFGTNKSYEKIAERIIFLNIF